MGFFSNVTTEQWEKIGTSAVNVLGDVLGKKGNDPSSRGYDFDNSKDSQSNNTVLIVGAIVLILL